MNRLIVTFLCVFALFSRITLAEDTKSYVPAQDDIVVEKADLASVLKIFGSKIDRTYIVDKGIKEVVSINVPKKTLASDVPKILDALLDQNGYKAFLFKDKYWVVLPKATSSLRKVPSSNHKIIKLDSNDREILLVSEDRVISRHKSDEKVVAEERSIEKKEISALLDELPDTLTKAKAVPYFKNSKILGLRVFSIQQDSFFDKIGLKNGDIVTGINDMRLDDYSITGLAKTFQRLMNEPNLKLLLIRGRKNFILSY